MAWNPTPEVQVARDAAKSLTKAGRFVDRCVILFTTEQGQLGYASYGKDSAHCGQARRLADVLYERASEAMEDVEVFHHRHDGDIAEGLGINWNVIEREAVLKLRLLKESLIAIPEGDARRMYMRDLVMPAVELLARFMNCVNIAEEPQTIPAPGGETKDRAHGTEG